MPRKNAPEPDLFGFKSYQDVRDNGVLYTIEELFALPVGSKVLVLDMQDKDDDYSLENRLFEGEVTNVTEDTVFLDNGYDFMREDDMDDEDESENDYFLIVQHAD